MTAGGAKRPGRRSFLACLWAALCCAPACAAQTAGPAPAVTSPAPSAAAATVAPKTLLAAGDFHGAEVRLREQLQADAGSREAHAALAYCLLRENEPAKALEEYTRAAAIAPPDSKELTAVGQAYVLLGDTDDADRWTLRATRTAPSDPDAWYSLGRIRYTEQRFGDAAVCFRHVLALSPRSVKAENNLGLAYEGTNGTEAAIAAYRQAIAWQEAARAENPSEQPYLNLGILLLHRGELAEAAKLLERAAALAPKDARVHEQLGQVDMRQADFGGAVHEFALACALDPGKSALHFLLGQALRRAGRPEDAQTQLALAAKLARTSAGSKND